jgi:hypothetical protein
MIRIRPMGREEMVARWRSPEERQRASRPPPRPLNLRAVLDLGEVIFFTFRGSPYGIPPLAWREGEALLDAWLELQEFGEQLERGDLPRWYQCLERIQHILWSNTRVVGRVRRVFRRLGLLRNPYRVATEGELAELALFFLARRKSASLHARPAAANGNGRET